MNTPSQQYTAAPVEADPTHIASEFEAKLHLERLQWEYNTKLSDPRNSNKPSKLWTHKDPKSRPALAQLYLVTDAVADTDNGSNSTMNANNQGRMGASSTTVTDPTTSSAAPPPQHQPAKLRVALSVPCSTRDGKHYDFFKGCNKAEGEKRVDMPEHIFDTIRRIRALASDYGQTVVSLSDFASGLRVACDSSYITLNNHINSDIGKHWLLTAAAEATPSQAEFQKQLNSRSESLSKTVKTLFPSSNSSKSPVLASKSRTSLEMYRILNQPGVCSGEEAYARACSAVFYPEQGEKIVMQCSYTGEKSIVQAVNGMVSKVDTFIFDLPVRVVPVS